MTQNSLPYLLEKLHLSSFLKHHEDYANRCRESDQSYEDYLYQLSKEECDYRECSRIKKLISRAKFPFRKTLTEYDFSQIKNLKKETIERLSDCQFISKSQNICLLGQTGTGKTHLAISIGLEACKKGFSVLFYSAAQLVNLLLEAQAKLTISRLNLRLHKASLIIIDELGYLPLSKEGSELLFQFFSERYEKSSVIITSNLEFSDWTKFMGDPTMTSALLDRITHHSHIHTLNGDSYRLKSRQKKGGD